MTTYLAQGSPDTNLNHEQLRNALERVFEKLGPRKSVLAVPPDFTRLDSRAGFITRAVHEHYGDRLKDVLPALGTHAPMSGEQLQEMYAGIPEHLIRVHNWRSDVVRVGNLSAEIVGEITHGAYAQPWPAELNRLVCEGGHDLIFSIGQVVPHEVAGMANHAKNLFIGTGGPGSINQSHFVGAVCGMEKAMGRDDTPVRRLLDLALVRFAEKLPIVFILTVVGRASDGEPSDPSGLVTRGLYVGTGTDCFALAAKLSRELNVQE
ncbi:MAG TPA: lactate racemase domain-containing protein, partial [Polyangiaceae bacterium]